jgi:hypothetical protein
MTPYAVVLFTLLMIPMASTLLELMKSFTLSTNFCTNVGFLGYATKNFIFEDQ